jgi:hypothetical protein
VVITPAIPVGIGVSVGGKLVVASLELTLEAKVGVKFDLGVSCGPGEAGCETFQKFEPVKEVKPNVKVPDADGMRVKLDGSVYLLSGLDIAVLFGAKTMSIVEIKSGPTQSANLAFVRSQAETRDYASSYELSWETSLGLGDGVKDLIKFFGHGLVAIDAKVEDKVALARSPTGTFVVDKAKIAANQNAMFAVTLRDYEEVGEGFFESWEWDLQLN